MIKDSELDWLSIEARFRAGESARAIAREVGIAHSRITRRAARFGWIPNPGGIKRERVRAALMGSPGAAAADELLEQAVQVDALDMGLGLNNARKILRKIEEQLETGVPMVRTVKVETETEAGRKQERSEIVTDRVEANPIALKTLGAANLAAIETIRRIRELDDPSAGGFFSKEERDAIVAAAMGPEA